MKKTIWIILFIIFLLVDLYAVYSNNETLRYVTKPLLMPLLVIYFVSATKPFISSLKKWTILALLFSWAGDVLLMFESMNGNFFIFGLTAFLIVHIFYIQFFASIERIEKFKRKFLLALLPVLWYWLLIEIVNPSSLGLLAWPLRIYGAILMIMFFGALNMGLVNKRGFGILIIAGALLFVFSDSVLAINKFSRAIEQAGIIVMSTYGLAQLLITLGAVRYITSTSKQ